jgi:hypothetical protein
MNMEVGSQWYNRIATDIEQYRVTLGQKDFKKHKLDLLLRIAKRVDGFSTTCSECEKLKQDITNLVQEMSMLIQMPNKAGFKRHAKAIEGMVEHLKKVHKLVEKGHYMGMGIGIGMAIGAVAGGSLGAILDNTGLGTAIGVGLGLAIGGYLDRKAREEGRVI